MQVTSRTGNPELKITLKYENSVSGFSTESTFNVYGMTRDEVTDEYFKDFIRACGFYVGNDEELFFRDSYIPDSIEDSKLV